MNPGVFGIAAVVIAAPGVTHPAHAQPAPVVAGTDPTNAAAPDPSSDPPTPAPAPSPSPAPAPAPAAPPVDVAALNAIVDARVDARLAARKDTAGWKDGFFVGTADGKTRLKIGGFTQFDGRFFVADSNDPHIDTFGFRSIRPDLQGTVLEHFDFRLLPDFAGAKLVLQDVYVDVHYGDAVKIRVGKFKVPFGLERLQGETNTLFVERGLPTQLVPNRDLGVQVFGEVAGGVIAYQAGIFDGVPDGQSGDGDVSDAKEGAARVFLRPFAQQPGRGDLGVGAAATYGDKAGTIASPDVAAFKTQGQTTFFSYRTGTTLMDTVVAGGKHWRVSGQGHYYRGPVGLLAEYVRSVQHVVLDGTHQTVSADSWQVAGQWVVTGDDATFKSVSPKHPLDPAKGQWGAVDVVARAGELRLTNADPFDRGFVDPTKSARRAWSAGGGVDWFANKNFRFVVDFERTWYTLGAKTGDRPAENSIVGRVQTVF